MANDPAGGRALDSHEYLTPAATNTRRPLSPLRSEVSLLETHDSQFTIAETSREKSLWLAPMLMLGGVLTLFGATVLCVGALGFVVIDQRSLE